jgi:tryptophan synthase alpha chain
MTEQAKTGVERINEVFAQRAGGKGTEGKCAAFMPYHAMGYPSRAATLEIIKTLAEVGADLFEIGVPHSDPLADGPAVQTATYTAITLGTTVRDCLAMCSELRAAGVTTPFVAMSYYNPLFAYGIQPFVDDAVAAGIDGLIVPDLPPEEADELIAACRAAGIATIFMIAPTSTETRIQFVAQRATGFIYMVSVTGITGIRTQLPPDLKDFIERVRRHTKLPLAVGFGIGTGPQAAAVAQIADGVVVGSALVRAAGADDPISAVRALGKELAEGSHSAQPA